MFWIVLGCYSYMFKKKGLRHRRRSAESQAQLPVRYLSRDSKFKPKSVPAVDSKFKPKSMPAVRYISYLDSVSIQGRAWRQSDRRHARGVSGAVESFSYPRSDRTGVSGVVWDFESGDLDIGYWIHENQDHSPTSPLNWIPESNPWIPRTRNRQPSFFNFEKRSCSRSLKSYTAFLLYRNCHEGRIHK